MTLGHTAAAAYDEPQRAVTITLGALTVADTLAGDNHRLAALTDAVDEASIRYIDAEEIPAGPGRDLQHQEAVEAFATELGAQTFTISPAVALQLASDLIRGAAHDPRIAEHPHLVELAACSVRRLSGAQQLLSGAGGLIEIPAVTA